MRAITFLAWLEDPGHSRQDQPHVASSGEMDDPVSRSLEIGADKAADQVVSLFGDAIAEADHEPVRIIVRILARANEAAGEPHYSINECSALLDDPGVRKTVSALIGTAWTEEIDAIAGDRAALRRSIDAGIRRYLAISSARRAGRIAESNQNYLAQRERTSGVPRRLAPMRPTPPQSDETPHQSKIADAMRRRPV